MGSGPSAGRRQRPGLDRDARAATGNQPPSTYTGTSSAHAAVPGGGGAPHADAGAVLDRHLRAQTGQTVGPIVGVRSKVHKEAFASGATASYYDEWRFIAGDADNDVDAADPAHPQARRGIRPTPRRSAADRGPIRSRAPGREPMIRTHVLDNGVDRPRRRDAGRALVRARRLRPRRARATSRPRGGASRTSSSTCSSSGRAGGRTPRSRA